MLSPEAGKRSGVGGLSWRSRRARGQVCRRTLCTLALIGLVMLAFSAVTAAQPGPDDEGYDFNRRGLDQLDRIHEALNRYGMISLKVGAVLLGIIIIKIISPLRLYHSANDRLLARAIRGVDELLKRIQKEAEETTGAEPEEEEMADGGVLAGMTEIAEFNEAEEVPSYVMTVNDRMLDNIRITLKRLQRFKEGHADRYRSYMFSVLKGIKTIAVESATSHVPSSLAVDVKAYFRDESRYKAWTKLLGGMKHAGEHQEVVDTFLLFIRNLRAGRPLAVPATTDATLEDTAIAASPIEPTIPGALNENTLPIIQQAAADEARHLVTLVQTGRNEDEDAAWQFELVRRQQHLHQRDEARRILEVFLSSERKVWPQVTRTRMLPCRTWPHVLHVLGVESSAVLQQRVEARQLSIQEIIILQKAFLQTFARRRSLEYIYGTGEDAELMIDMHVPQIRRESLALLRRSHRTEPNRFDRATEALNEAETPQHNEARKLIEHYVNHEHQPPDVK